MRTLLVGFILAFFFAGCVQSTPSATAKMNRSKFQTVPVQQAMLLQKSDSCAICGMHLPTFYKTNHAADTKDGIKQYCSLHCVVKDNEFNKTDLKNLKVVDTDSLKFISALDAFYVVGSKKSGTMSMVSKYAFSTKAKAEAFAKEFGGKVMKFYDAYKEATKDFTNKR
jgi:nitrous oxide reductase accessory protein NosL